MVVKQLFWQNEAKIFNDINVESIKQNSRGRAVGPADCVELFFGLPKRACAARISEADFKDATGKIKSNRPEVTSACSE